MTRIHDGRIGRITYVDLAQLADIAKKAGAEINLAARPGTLADPARLLAWTTASLDEKQHQNIRDAFSIAHNRSFDHDPRFGLVVLSEIASRALSPAVNDPGTAIAVIEAGTRVMAGILRHRPDPDRAPPAGVNVPAPAFAFPDRLEDLYRPIARDGAGTIEVGVRLQKALASLQRVASDVGMDFATVAADALDRAVAACDSHADADRIARIHAGYWSVAG